MPSTGCRAVADAADVHAGAQPDVLERVEGLDRLLVVGDLRAGGAGGAPALGAGADAWAAAFVIGMRSTLFAFVVLGLRSRSRPCPIPADSRPTRPPVPRVRKGSGRRRLPAWEIRAPGTSWGGGGA